jgi:hypothetical protein
MFATVSEEIPNHKASKIRKKSSILVSVAHPVPEKNEPPEPRTTTPPRLPTTANFPTPPSRLIKTRVEYSLNRILVGSTQAIPQEIQRYSCKVSKTL